MTADIKMLWMVIIKKIPFLLVGYILFAAGTLATLYAGLGMSPWGAFHMGISNHTPFTLGEVTQLVGVVILIASYWMEIIPGIGSIGNMFFIGAFIDIIDNLHIFKTPETLIGRLLMLFFGIFITGWGTYFYLKVHLGAGPRDGLMEGLVKKLKKPVWLIRGVMESTVLIIGYLLGGPAGIGTVITALTLGFSVEFAFKVGRYNSKEVRHMNCVEMFKLLTGKTLSQETSCH